MKYFFSYIILLLAFMNHLPGKAQTGLFLLHEVPWSARLNPAVQISCRFFAGISSFHFSYFNNVFTYKDLTEGDALNLDKVYRQMGISNLVALNAEFIPLSLGYRHKRNYYSFSMAEKASLSLSYPKKLIGFSLYGNSQFLGRTARFKNLRINSLYYREYSFGFSTIPDFFTMAGARVKLLFGKANIHTSRSSYSLSALENNFVLDASGDLRIKSSYPLEIVQDNSGMIDNVLIDYPNIPSLLFNYRNPGLAIDAGIIRRYTKNITLSASILDLGFIRWSSDISNVRAEADFKYAGIAAGSSFSARGFLDELADSLRNSSGIEISRKPYFISLPLQVFLAAEYRWKENISLGVVNRNLVLNKRIYSSLTFTANSLVFDRLITGLSWSVMNRSINHAGAAVAWIGRGFQVHILSDNVRGLFKPFDTRTIDLQFGMNFLLACPHTEREARLYNSLYGRIPGGNCSWIEKTREKNKYLDRVSRKRKY